MLRLTLLLLILNVPVQANELRAHTPLISSDGWNDEDSLNKRAREKILGFNKRPVSNRESERVGTGAIRVQGQNDENSINERARDLILNYKKGPSPKEIPRKVDSPSPFWGNVLDKVMKCSRYIPVCGQLSFDCPYGADCAQPEPQTFANICELEKVGASLISEGECLKEPRKQISNCDEDAPVCGQPSFRCPKGVDCAPPLPRTYPNLCAMEQDEASFVRKGKCESRIVDEDGCLGKKYPVCGIIVMPVDCYGENCPKTKVQKRTFANLCELNKHGATLVHESKCLDSVSPKPTNPLPHKECPIAYKPVCGQPSFDCPYGADCAPPVARTYSNLCVMNQEGAKLISEGECRDMSRPTIPSTRKVISKPRGGGKGASR